MQAALRILHVEDSGDDAALLRLELEAAGYQLHYRQVETASEMADLLRSEPWDVVLSDFNLPTFNAYDALRILKDSGRDIPLIVVSGFIGEMDAVALMKAGAHDYVMKDKLARLGPAIEREIKEAASREQRRQADHALAANRKLLENINRSLGEGLLVLDMNGHLLMMNAEAERLLGWTQAELAPVRSMRPSTASAPTALRCPARNARFSAAPTTVKPAASTTRSWCARMARCFPSPMSPPRSSRMAG